MRLSEGGGEIADPQKAAAAVRKYNPAKSARTSIRASNPGGASELQRVRGSFDQKERLIV